MSVASPVDLTGVSAPQRLRRSSEIRSVLRSRQKAVGRHVLVHFRDREQGREAPGRVAVIAGRRVGPAVRRTRAKRRLRAAARDCGIPPGRDVVLVAREGTDVAPWEELRREVAEGCQRRPHG